MVDVRRVYNLNGIEAKGGSVVYWMSRDQRVDDNWALLYAAETAVKMKQPVAVVFALAHSFLGAALRQYSFMLDGLALLEKRLDKLGIPFFILPGNPPAEILNFTVRNKAGTLVTDFSPLRPHRQWKEEVSKTIRIPFKEVDSHNVVPCRLASDRQEFSARTIRPKIHRLLPEFLTEPPAVKRHPFAWSGKRPANDFDRLAGTLKIHGSPGRLERPVPGGKEALAVMKDFIARRLDGYERNRNNPLLDGQSNLSPYIHFGQISAQRIALETQKAGKDSKSTESFIEELVVRRELAENFCFYNSNYDSYGGFPKWARENLEKHKRDKRDYVYSLRQFESAETHDDLWNAAQTEMLASGKMHGYMRMYWAKKILEWSRTPEEALETAVYLNDRYELDGRDPNGYAGIAWSIGGLHDRPWFKRPVYGSVRYMSRGGMERKFDGGGYIGKHTDARLT